MIVDTQERSTTRLGVRCAMCAASLFFGRGGGGGALMWILPLHLHVNQKFDYDDYDVDMRVFSLTSIL